MKNDPATSAIVKERIEAALKRSASLEALTLCVTTANSRVKLQGRVKSWGERADAERAAWSAPGVTEVENLITVG